ncbi:MAG: methyltransferase domain-containing protein [Planctomycetes bacterium]|nr:methyltransferase domain-containing protein [Planctomycetota bacterium]
MTDSSPSVPDVERAVRSRYSDAARVAEARLCCPVIYDPALLAAIPENVLERDYGCGDPSRFLGPGERVLDLGSGAGKACFLASQKVGPEGHVIGIDMNDEMLAVARGAAPEVARRLGYANVSFRKGRIQDLALDLEALDSHLERCPVRSADDLSRLDGKIAELRQVRPLVADASIDVVVSSCVLNLVRPEDKERLFAEIHRVLRRGGRAVISDIVSDEDVPERLARDPDLWSGCISGAFREDHFLEAFEKAGFYGIALAERGDLPWRTVEGIEFRSVTVIAYKGKEGPCLDQKHAVIYRGPFRKVEDDDGHLLMRGARTAVCEKTFQLYSREPYREHVELVWPRVLVPLEEAPPFPCGKGGVRRDPRETKGADYFLTTDPEPGACGTDGRSGGACCS